MNITKQVVDDVNVVISLEICKEDYAEAVEKSLKSYRQRVQMPGFRKGMVPMGLVKKQVGAQVTYDEVNRLINSSLYNYISENKLNVLGEPMLNEEQKPVDFMAEDNFTVSFNIALAPEFDAKISKKDKITCYDSKVDDALVDQQVQSYCQRGGQHVKADDYKAGDMVKGLLTQLDAEGNALEGGISVEEAVMLPEYMKNDEEKGKFTGAKVGDVMTFNPSKAYNESQTELASLLRISKEEAAEMKADFSFQISEIFRMESK